MQHLSHRSFKAKELAVAIITVVKSLASSIKSGWNQLENSLFCMEITFWNLASGEWQKTLLSTKVLLCTPWMIFHWWAITTTCKLITWLNIEHINHNNVTISSNTMGTQTGGTSQTVGCNQTPAIRQLQEAIN